MKRKKVWEELNSVERVQGAIQQILWILDVWEELNSVESEILREIQKILAARMKEEVWEELNSVESS